MTGGDFEPPGLAQARCRRPGHPGGATLALARSRTPPTATSPTTCPRTASPCLASRISPLRRLRRTGLSGATQAERDCSRGPAEATGCATWTPG